MSKRKWAVGSFVPCSPRHHHCSPAHAEFVNNYRIERHRQEVENEAVLTNPTERAIWRENGGEIVTFKSWLIAHKGSGMKHQEESWNSQQSDQFEPVCTLSAVVATLNRDSRAGPKAGESTRISTRFVT